LIAAVCIAAAALVGCGGSSEPPTLEVEQKAVLAFNEATPKMKTLFDEASRAAAAGDEDRACDYVHQARDTWDAISDDVDVLRRTPRWNSEYRADVEYNEHYLDNIGC
jgi:hypothetical protein